MALIHTSNNHLEDNGKETPFTIAAKKINSLRVSLTGKWQNLYKKMPPTFERDNVNLNKWQDIPCYWIE